MDIRPLEPRDLPRVEAICRTSFSRIYAHFALRGLDHCTTLVAADGREVVGFEELQELLGGRVGNVYYVAVDPDRRGKGIGRALLNRGLEWIGGQGSTYAMASVPRTNGASLALFAAAGFTPWTFGEVRRSLGLGSALGLYNGAMVAPHERVLLRTLGAAPGPQTA